MTTTQDDNTMSITSREEQRAIVQQLQQLDQEIEKVETLLQDLKEARTQLLQYKLN